MANGRGGYASGTVTGTPTRRYHGLLVAALHPPSERLVTVTHLEERVRTQDGEWALSSHAWPGVVDPKGHLHLESFTFDRRPTWRWRVRDLFLEKTLFVQHGHDTVLLEYRHLSGPPAELSLRPFVVQRDHHALTRENAAFRPLAETLEGRIRLHPYADLPALWLVPSGGRFLAWPVWYKNFEYVAELERGLDFREDSMSPGAMVIELSPAQCLRLAFSTEPEDRLPPAGEALGPWALDVWKKEMARLDALTSPPARKPERIEAGEERLPPETLRLLTHAADAFLVDDGRGPAVIAGYPWHSTRTRDTLLALPGLLVLTGRLDVGRRLLERFVGTGTKVETADEALWFAIAAARYVELSDDATFLEKTLAPALSSFLDSLVTGDVHGFRVDEQGLLDAPDPERALTWMDARVEGRPATPRPGRTVETNALWYTGWRIREQWAQSLGLAAEAGRAGAFASRIRDSFRETFWSPARGYLADRADSFGADPALRPNQLYAVSLAHPVLEGDPACQVLEAVEKALLTPFGVRTLAPGDPHYRGTCAGDTRAREMALHNGAAWPFLLGAWSDAHFRVRGRNRQTRDHARRVLEPLVHHLLADGCLGQIEEVFDGDVPHVARGAFARVTSVAELGRVWIEGDL